MALAVSFRFDFVDIKNESSFTKIRTPSTFSIAQYTEFALAMGQLLSNISAVRLTGASATFSISLSGLSLKAAATAVADVFQKGYFSFNSSATGFRKRLRIPTFDEAKVGLGSDNIDTLDAAVAAFNTAMTNGIVVAGGTVQPVTERGHDLVSLNEAREVFQRHS